MFRQFSVTEVGEDCRQNRPSDEYCVGAANEEWVRNNSVDN